MQPKNKLMILSAALLFACILIVDVRAGAYNFTLSPERDGDKKIVVTKGASVYFACFPSDYEGSISTYTWLFDNGDPGISDEACPGLVTYGEGAEGLENEASLWIDHVDEESMSCPNDRVTVAKVVVPKFEVLELTFKSDHAKMTDKTDNSGNGGTVYSEPEYKSSGTNYPISHTRNQNVEVKLKVKVTPADTPAKTYNVVGAGPTGLNYDDNKSLSGGEANEITVTSTDKLENKIYKATGSIDWTFKLEGGTSTKATTGSHKVYVLNGDPAGSDPTDWRINWVVNKASGETTAHGALGKIHGGTFALGSATPNPIWKIADGVSGACIHLVTFDNAAIQMLGWGGGSIMYCYPKLSKGSKESANANAWDTRPSDNAELCYLDGNGGLNNWEATLKYTEAGTTKWYAGGAGSYASVQLVMNAVCDKSVWCSPGQGPVIEVAEDW